MARRNRPINMPAPYLRRIWLEPSRIADRAAYPFPALFLLDLKMPVKDGLEVLQWLHEHPDIPSKLPVVIFSSTELPNETQIAYAMDIQACIVKPLSYPELREKLRILKEYWLDYEAGV